MENEELQGRQIEGLQGATTHGPVKREQRSFENAELIDSQSGQQCTTGHGEARFLATRTGYATVRERPLFSGIYKAKRASSTVTANPL